MESEGPSESEKSVMENLSRVFTNACMFVGQGVNCPSKCAMCEESYEDATRVLFECSKARNAWLNCSLIDKVTSVMLKNNTTAEITYVLLRELTREKAEPFAMNL